MVRLLSLLSLLGDTPTGAAAVELPLQLPELLVVALGMALELALYLLPTLVATLKNCFRLQTIFAANLLLGWTGVVWVALLGYVALFCHHGQPQLAQDSLVAFGMWVGKAVLGLVVLVLALNVIGVVSWLW